LIIADLGELERDGTWSVARASCFMDSLADSVHYSCLWLSSRLTISDGNDEKRLSHLSTAEAAEEDIVDDLLLQVGTHGCQAAESMASDQLLDLLFGPDARGLLCGRVGVHEAKVNTVVVEKGGGESDTRQNKLQVLDALALLFELH